MHHNGRVADRTDVEDAARSLYALPPDDFMERRAQLSAQARAGGNGDAARAIDRLRKPTVAAWIVNALVLDDPSVVDQLTDLGRRLRDAQDALDATRLRDLSTERRTLVGRLTKDAFHLAGRSQPPAGLRDEVTGTFEAAIADADLAGRLGTLQRAEQWSGFGFLPTGAPELTLVRGGRDDAPKQPRKAAEPATPAKPAKPKRSAAERRRQERALSAARQSFEAADAACDEARGTEQSLSQEIRRLTKKLAKLQSQLDGARTELETTRKEVTATRAKRREARSALDRAEREAAD
jgi:hypothetical protein